MPRVPTVAVRPTPTNLAPLPELLAYAQSLGLEEHLGRAKRGATALALALPWLALAWRGSGRPEHLDHLAESPRRSGRVWVALDAHQAPYWGRNKLARFAKGWSGSRSRQVRGCRLYLAVGVATGQVVTYVLARGGRRDAAVLALLARRCRARLGRRLAGVVADCGFTSRRSLFALAARSPTDRRGLWVYVTSRRSWGPATLATTYRQRWRVEQAIEELLHGADLDHLVTYRLSRNHVAIGFRLLARNLAIGYQIKQAGARPEIIREPRAFRAEAVEGLAAFTLAPAAIQRFPLRPAPAATYSLPWAGVTVHYVPPT